MWPTSGRLLAFLLSAPVTFLLASADSSSHGSSGTKTTTLWNATWTDQLKHDLLMKYDKFARPAQHYNTTVVTINLVIRHVEVDEAKSMVIINAWTKMYWKDEKLKWNASDYGGLTNLNVADHEIWQPDVVLYNSAQGSSVDHYGNTHCIVSSDGFVQWVPPAQFFVFCDINLRKWPYDEQTCILQFGSWTYSGEQIHLDIDSKDVDVDLDPCEWIIVSATKQKYTKFYSCCSEPYFNVDFKLIMQRRSPAYHATLFTPAFVCIVLTLSVFWLPPSASEKFMLSGVTAVIISLFLVHFAQRLPTMAVHTPIIVEFYAYNMVMVGISMLVSVIAVNLSQKPQARPVPWVIMKLHTGYLGFILGLPTTKNSLASMYPDQDSEELHERSLVAGMSDEAQDMTKVNFSRDWTLVAIALDRIMFIIYLLIFVILLLTFLL